MVFSPITGVKYSSFETHSSLYIAEKKGSKDTTLVSYFVRKDFHRMINYHIYILCN